ncbi:hypothetical protein [Maricaulis sp.]|uniref:hypothetical protein n=1 Tax=Maricaulis sp. TaxID=1486257 RepID=UPI003A9184F1
MARKSAQSAPSTASETTSPPAPALDCVMLRAHPRVGERGVIRALQPAVIAELKLVKGKDYRLATPQDRAIAGR